MTHHELHEVPWLSGGSDVGAAKDTRACPLRARVVGGYTLGETLGEGSFGRVRVGTKDGVRYAVKILDRARVEQNNWAHKVRREVAIMRALEHPRVVGLRRVLRSAKKIYLVMDLVSGGELYWKVQNDGPMEESSARRLFQQLVDGVLYCHSKGVYHRDLKPENLLLEEDGLALRITDFGLSAVNPHPGTEMLLRTACGSPHYCAPEVRGRRETSGYSGEKIDAWSCGVILYLLLTGSLPFHHDDPGKLQAQIDSADVLYPPDFPDGARDLCARLLEKSPRARISLPAVLGHPWFAGDYVPTPSSDANAVAFALPADTECEPATPALPASVLRCVNRTDEENDDDPLARSRQSSIDSLTPPGSPQEAPRPMRRLTSSTLGARTRLKAAVPALLELRDLRPWARRAASLTARTTTPATAPPSEEYPQSARFLHVERDRERVSTPLASSSLSSSQSRDSPPASFAAPVVAESARLPRLSLLSRYPRAESPAGGPGAEYRHSALRGKFLLRKSRAPRPHAAGEQAVPVSPTRATAAQPPHRDPPAARCASHAQWKTPHRFARFGTRVFSNLAHRTRNPQ